MDAEFVEAAERGVLSRVRALLPWRDEACRVEALTRAVFNQRMGAIDYLLKIGVPVEHESCCTTPLGYPLHAAVACGNFHLLRQLLDAGAHPNVFDNRGCTPLSMAVSGPAISALLDAGADANAGAVTLLHRAAVDRNTDPLRQLLTLPGIDVNVKTRFTGCTPLHFAAEIASVDGVEMLLAAGADPCAVNKDMLTPLRRMYDLGMFDYDFNGDECRIATLLVAAGDRSLAYIPSPCPGLEAALVPVWASKPVKFLNRVLCHLFERLEPEVQGRVRAALCALHRGGLDETLRMKVLEMALK